MQDRGYQNTAVAEMLGHLSAGKRPLLVAPTGAGKSVMSSRVLTLDGARLSSGQTLCLVHTRTLREQSKVTIPGAQISTIQGLVAKGPAGDKRRSALASITDVFVDEAHHIVSEEWAQAIPLLQGRRFFGATATPERGDGTPLGDAFDVMVVAAKYSELVTGGHLCPCDIRAPEMNRKEQRRKKVKPDGVVAYLTHGKRADGSWRPGIYFEGTKAECHEAAKRFTEAGLRCAVVTDQTTTDERAFIFAQYTLGHLDMLLSPQALAEGFDSPRAEVCVLCRSAAHVGGFLQMVGRVLRPYGERQIAAMVALGVELGITPDPSAFTAKERALLIDNSDATSVHGKPTADRVYSLDGQGIALAPEEDATETDELGEPSKRERAKMVEMKFRLVRDKLRDMFGELQGQAVERNYNPGWVFHRFTEKTGIQPPRAFKAKFQSTCKHCRTRFKIDESILWDGPGRVWHHDCWFDTIVEQQLLSADDLQPKAQRILADIERQAPQASTFVPF